MYVYIMKSIVNKILLDTIKNKKGVYAFYINEHMYIGSSINLYSRYKEHLASLKKGNHYNNFLQRCADKYGIVNLKYKVLEICDNYVERETFYIKTLNPNMNVEKDPISKSKSETTKTKIGLANKGKLSGKNNPAARKVHQYDSKGFYIKTYDTMQEASLAVNLSRLTLNANSIKRTKKMGGYMWCTKKVKKLNPPKPNKGVVKYKALLQIDPVTNKITKWKSMTAFAIAFKITVQAVQQAITKDKPCQGFKLQIQLN